MTPEARARIKIDTMLEAAGWIVQSRGELNLHAGPGVAVREVPTPTGPADYVLFLDRKACAVLEAKPEGVTLLGTAPQGTDYAVHAPSGYPHWGDPLPFTYLSTGSETLFRDGGDPVPAPRRIFAVHRPESLRRRLQATESFRSCLAGLPSLDATGLRACQAEAIDGVEASLRASHPRALVQMATGAGKTYTACALAHRLLSHAGARRILFLVDRANLGTQTVAEFKGYRPPGSTLFFHEEFPVQHLRGRTLDRDAAVVVCTIQRLYAALRGQDLDETDEEGSGFEHPQTGSEHQVGYSAAFPPETFDLVIVDECHRSIYGTWRQVLDYFDAFLVGLTATPGRHTLGFFGQNLVSEYPFERSVADGVNVGFDVYRIRTEVGERGGSVQAGYAVPHRERATRRRRWAALAEDLDYAAAQLNRAVEVPNQIRTVLEAYRAALPTQLFRGRREIPKTLIFCLNESHAETVTEIARQVLGLDDTGVQKITYRSTGRTGQDLIKDFRTSHRFRVAVTVDMVATGTDIKPLECVIFLRDVRSAQYFEQMKGRGARTIRPDDLRLATPSARAKDRFVVVDAVGVTESGKVATEPLDRDRSATLKQLLDRAGFGHTDEDLCCTIAARLARLDRRLPPEALARLTEAAGGTPLAALARALVDSADPAAIEVEADHTGTAPDVAAENLREAALRPLATDPGLRRALLEEQQRAEVVIDELTPDRVLSDGFDAQEAGRVADSFRRFLDGHADQLAALQVLYARPYAARRVTYTGLRDLADAMARPPWLLDSARVWGAYRRLNGADRVRDPSPVQLLTDLVALVRYALGQATVLEPLAPEVERRFNLWLGREKNAGREYSEDQTAWLRLLRDAVAANAEVLPGDLRAQPQFATRGGMPRARRLFGAERLEGLLEELSEQLMPSAEAA